MSHGLPGGRRPAAHPPDGELVRREPLRLLYFEDDPADAALVRSVLDRAGVVHELRVVSTRAALAAELQWFRPVVILADYRIADCTALEALPLVRQHLPECPLIVVTGSVGEERAAETIKAGAADYVLKDNLDRLIPALERAVQLRAARDQTSLALDALERREARFRRLVEHSNDLILVLDRRGSVDYVSGSVERLLGYAVEDVAGRPAVDFLHEDDHAYAATHLRALLADPNAEIRAEYRCRHRDGTWRYLEGVAVNRLEDQVVGGIVTNFRDITDRKQAELALRASEQRYALAARGANDGLWDWDLEAGTVYYSPRWKAMLGYGDAEVSDAMDEWLRLVHPDDRPGFQTALERHLAGGDAHLEVEYRIRHRAGDYRWVLCRGLAVRGPAGRPLRIAGSQSDITDRKEAERRLVEEATRDALTGLPNRAQFVEMVSRAAQRSRAQADYWFGVLFLDVDRFKVVNDSLGHQIGDRLLVAISRRLERCLRPGDSVARLGGDEFTVLVDGIRERRDAERVAARIQRALAEPFELDGHEVYATVSIGIAATGGADIRWEDVLRNADLAMYRAKSRGRARHEFFDAAMHAEAVALLELETDLRRAVGREEFVLHYQPVMDLATNRAIGMEALLRWRHPERGLLKPAAFLEVAEEAGIIIPVGRWVLFQACRQMQEWLGAGSAPLSVAINLSAKQLLHADLVTDLQVVLAETGIAPERLILEVTESGLLSRSGAEPMISAVRALGVGIHVDDFGTGYSALSYLYQLPIDAIKIDRSFIASLATDERQSEVLRAILSLGQTLGLGVIAEGVETESQLQRLRQLECPAAQGDFLAPAGPPDVVQHWVRQG